MHFVERKTSILKYFLYYIVFGRTSDSSSFNENASQCPESL